MTDAENREKLLETVQLHVPFDGWSTVSFEAAARDAGVESGVAKAIFPRGAIDLALAFHRAGDDAMIVRLETTNLDEMRFRDRVAAAVRFRLEAVGDKEMVRRGTTLFALPHNAPDGAQAIWGTCDRIWTALGDTSRDVNWYTKRATLSGVYASTVLFWLGDDSPNHSATWEFLDRRIDDVMQIEKFKAKARESKLMGGVLAGPLAFLSKIKAPETQARSDLPGRWSTPE